MKLNQVFVYQAIRFKGNNYEGSLGSDKFDLEFREGLVYATRKTDGHVICVPLANVQQMEPMGELSTASIEGSVQEVRQAGKPKRQVSKAAL